MLAKEKEFSLWVLSMYADTHDKTLKETYELFKENNLFQSIEEGFEIYHVMSLENVFKDLDAEILRGGYVRRDLNQDK